MKLKKQKKSKRMRGRRTHGKSAKLNKGSGNRGGKGMAGTGKRADQKKTKVINELYPYFGKKGFTSRKTLRVKNRVMNVGEVEEKFKAGEVNLKEFKILGEGEVKKKFKIHAKSASQSAVEKIKKAGGEIILPEVKKAEKKEDKEKKK